MDINTLHPHNREAYQKIMQHFGEGNQRACVVHATGTGKSYIINAVSDHFERVLIMTTNMFTIDQVRDTIKAESPERTSEPTYMIYQGLLQDMKDGVDYSNQFDLIALDEFHHTGAEQWGKAIEWVIEQNPNAKVLGTSATAIRHSDGMRDMGEELFDGHVLSRLPLGEAWARKILMAPYYIMAVEDSEEFHNEFIKKIEESKLLEEKKHYYREMASHLKDNYEMEKNAAEIIRKWLPSDSRRIIVFSRNIEEAESNVSKVEGWMKKAGFDIDCIYMVHSQRPFEEKKAQMAAFQTDNFNGIKIMVAVDMLNEGVHIPRVDAVFFLRKTESPTIFLQQMGRCMGLYKEGGRRPVVFDFRNNVENTNRSTSTCSFFGEAAKDYDNWKGLEEKSLDSQTIRDTDKEEKFRENFPDGINYTMDYEVMLDRFGEDLSNADWDANYAEAKAFYEVHGRFPKKSENKRIRDWATQWYRKIYLINPIKNEIKKQKLEDIGFCYKSKYEIDDLNWKYKLHKIKEHYEKYGEFPKENRTLTNWCGDWWRNHYLKNREVNEERAQILRKVGYIYRSAEQLYEDRWTKNYEEAKAFFDEYGHFPTYEENYRLRYWAIQYCSNKNTDQDKINKLSVIGFIYQGLEDKSRAVWEKKYQQAKIFFDKHGRFPAQKDNRNVNNYIMNWWRRIYMKNKDKYKVEAMKLKNIGFYYSDKEGRWNKMFLTNYNECKLFFYKNGRFPEKRDNKRLSAWAYNWWKKSSKEEPDKAIMLTQIGFKYFSPEDKRESKWSDNYIEAKDFFEEYGHFPAYKENRKIYGWARNWWKNNYLKNQKLYQEKADMLIAIGFEYKGKKQ